MTEEELRQLEERIRQLESRMDAEEQRNQYLVAWLWEFGNTSETGLLPADARRLALACDPNLTWPPEVASDPQ